MNENPRPTRKTYPLGNLALTSTLPYRIPTFPFVLILALIMGLITVPSAADVTAVHAEAF